MLPAKISLPKLKKAFHDSIIFTILTLSFFVNPLFVTNVEADYLQVQAPAEISQNTAFEVNLTVSAKPNSSYFVKARLGQSPNSLTKGQTLDSNSGVWLSDSVAWDRFPKFQTDEDGNWKGKIQTKPSSNAALGNNLLVIRIHYVDDGSTKDSEPYQISILEPPPAPEKPKVVDQGKPILSEFLPSGGQEWVEIQNTGQGSADLSDWLVDDEEGKSSPFKIPAGTILSPGAYYVANFSSPKLNDVTDSIRLLKPDNTLIEEYRYNSPEKGKSFTKDSSGNWFITAEITPGTKNSQPPQVLASTGSKKPQVLAATSEEEVEPKTQTTLPKISTRAAKIATVGSSFKDQDQEDSLVGKLPFLFGGLLVVAAIVILGKNSYKKFRIRSSSETILEK